MIGLGLFKEPLGVPLALGSAVPVKGRVRECAELIRPGRRLLDVGCSSGWLAPHVRAMGYERYVGVDQSITGDARRIPGTTFIAGTCFDLPFPDCFFDAVCFFDVIEHLPRGSEVIALREISRVLTEGGRLYFSTPHASPLHSLFDPIWVLGHRHYRRGTVRRLMEMAGLSVTRLFVAGGLVECMDHIRLLVCKHLLHRDRRPIRVVDYWIEKSHGLDRAMGMTVFAVAAKSTN